MAKKEVIRKEVSPVVAIVVIVLCLVLVGAWAFSRSQPGAGGHKYFTSQDLMKNPRLRTEVGEEFRKQQAEHAGNP